MAIDSKTVWVRFMMYTVQGFREPGLSEICPLMRLGTPTGPPWQLERPQLFATYNGTAIEKVNTVLQRKNTATKLNDSANKNRWICWGIRD